MRMSPASAFLTELTADLTARSASDDQLIPFVTDLRTVDLGAQRYESAAPFEHPTMRHLQTVLNAATGAHALVDATRKVAQIVKWYQIFQGSPDIDPALAEGLLAAQVAGTVGMYSAQTVRCGLFLLAPGVHYPPHTHAAHEIYYCLSGEVELAYGLGAGAFRLTPGALSVTPPHRLHSVTTHGSPALLIYVWIGPVDEPNWWWKKEGDGKWSRTRWTRSPDASWQRTADEPVSDATMHEALGRTMSK